MTNKWHGNGFRLIHLKRRRQQRPIQSLRKTEANVVLIYVKLIIKMFSMSYWHEHSCGWWCPCQPPEVEPSYSSLNPLYIQLCAFFHQLNSLITSNPIIGADQSNSHIVRQHRTRSCRITYSFHCCFNTKLFQSKYGQSIGSVLNWATR